LYGSATITETHCKMVDDYSQSLGVFYSSELYLSTINMSKDSVLPGNVKKIEEIIKGEERAQHSLCKSLREREKMLVGHAARERFGNQRNEL
jgi:hypothetical protein